MSSLYVLYDNPELNLRVRPATPIFQLVRRAVAALRTWNDRRIARGELRAMPNYILRDLGIDHASIDAVVRGRRRTC